MAAVGGAGAAAGVWVVAAGIVVASREDLPAVKGHLEFEPA